MVIPPPKPGKGLMMGEETIREGVFNCVSKKHESHKLILTSTGLSLKGVSGEEHYDLDDLFGCHTLRHKKQAYTAAYICFYLYPRGKKRRAKYRHKLTLVFEVKGSGEYETNLLVASEWKRDTLRLIGTKYPKWQVNNQQNNNNIEEVNPSSFGYGGKGDGGKGDGRGMGDGIYNLGGGGLESRDEMDQLAMTNYPNESPSSLTTFIPLLRRYLVIVNPKSGQGKTMTIFEDKVRRVLMESGVGLDLLITLHPGHARTILAAADLSEVDGIITVGGDGILYEVVNGLRSRKDAPRINKIPIGVIAGGSGNGLARSIADYSGEAEDYLKNPVLSSTLAAARGKVIKVNLAEVRLDREIIYSFLSVGWGLLADIDVESEVLRGLGESRFTIWSFYRLMKLKAYPAILSYIPWNKACQDKVNAEEPTSDLPQPVVVDGNFVCIYSSCQSYIGSDLVFAPTATPEDGLIHLVYLLEDIGRTKATQFLISIDRGTHLEVEGVKYVTVKEFSIKCRGGLGGNLTIDGERVIGEEISVKLAQQPLTMFSL